MVNERAEGWRDAPRMKGYQVKPEPTRLKVIAETRSYHGGFVPATRPDRFRDRRRHSIRCSMNDGAETRADDSEIAFLTFELEEQLDAVHVTITRKGCV